MLYGHGFLHIRDSNRGLLRGHPRGRSDEIRHQQLPRGSSVRLTEDEQEGSGTDEGRGLWKDNNQSHLSETETVRVQYRRIRIRRHVRKRILRWRMRKEWAALETEGKNARVLRAVS